jgi:hypothetical protein
MQAHLKELMEEKAVKELESMDDMEPGSDDRQIATENATKLYKAIADEESQQARAKHDRDSLKIAIAGGVGAAVVQSVWNYSNMYFEEKHGGFANFVSRGIAQQLTKFRLFKLK